MTFSPQRSKWYNLCKLHRALISALYFICIVLLLLLLLDIEIDRMNFIIHYCKTGEYDFKINIFISTILFYSFDFKWVSKNKNKNEFIKYVTSNLMHHQYSAIKKMKRDRMKI